MVVFASLYYTIAITDHYLFRTYAFDYGPYNFAFWDYSHFHITNCRIYNIIHANKTFFQDHFSLTLIYLVPIYWLFNWLTGTYTLILIQVTLVLFGGWGIYRLVLLKTNDGWLAVCAVLYYFLLQGHYSMFGGDCNILVMASSLLILFVYFFEKEKYIPATIFFLLALISREDIPLWIIFICIVLLTWHRNERTKIYTNLILIAVSLTYFILMFKVFIPGIETPGEQYSLFNYTALGKTPSDAFSFILHNPFRIFGMLFYNFSNDANYNGVKKEFYLVYLISGGFLLFLRPRYFIWFIPVILQKMLNDGPMRWSIEWHYSIQMTTLLPISVFLIISEIKQSRLKYRLSVIVCFLTLCTTVYKMNPVHHRMYWSNITKANPFTKKFFTHDFNATQVHKDLELIPPDASVSASAAVLSHLAQRKYICEFPNIYDAQYIAAFAYSDYYEVSQQDYNTEFYKYVFSPDWNIINDDSPFFIFKKEPNKSPFIRYDSIVCNAETISADKQFYIASNGDKLDHAETRDSAIVRHGKYSMRLDKDHSYEMVYSKEFGNENSIVQVTVWCYSKKNNFGYFVAGTESGIYMPFQSDINTDTNGWKQVVIYLAISKYTHHFNFYLWNKDQEPIWFDDLKFVTFKRKSE